MNEEIKDQTLETEEDLSQQNSEDLSDLVDDETQEIEEISTDDLIKDLEDQILRSKAEVQNVRRIAPQEVTKARLFGVESLAREFLSVGDNLERAILSCQDGEGLSLIHI